MAEPRCANVPPAEGREDLDRLLDRFEGAWRAGTPPAIEDFLPARGPGRRPVLYELVKIDLEYRWRRTAAGAAGWPARPRLEDYAARLARLGPPGRLPLDLIGEEYRVRQCWGDRPRAAEYAGRFPHHGAALGEELARIDAELAAECRPTRQERRVDDKSLSRPRAASLRCPHCHRAIEVVAELLLRSLVCPACGEAFGVEALPAASGAGARPPAGRLGRYELGALLGTGAFGSVWQAQDTQLGRAVAVKVPRVGQFSGPAEEERFLREARSAAQLHHPGIVAVYDVGRERETLYIVSELVRGRTLAEWLRDGRLSFPEAADLVALVADALDYAHRQGVVHRDVKPSNILLEVPEGPAGDRRRPARPLVLDFGLALRDAGEVTLTLDGQVLGTPAYMSPEQVRNPHAVDGRSDVYSLGVILYELLTGELPFRGLARMLLHQVVSDPPRPPRRLDDRVPRDLETICLKCLAKEPARRYPTAAALAADLRRWRRGKPIRARPTGRVEQLVLWARRNPALVATGLGAAALLSVTGPPAAAVPGAPVVAALAAVAAGSLLFALHKARVAGEWARAIEEVKRKQQKTGAALEFAFRHYSQARQAQKQAGAAEARAKRRLAQVRGLARAVLFDLPDRLGDPAGPAPARALLVRAALDYLDGLAKEAGDDPLLLRELAVAYARVGEVQAGPCGGGGAADPAGALASYHKSLDIFEALARTHPDNAQAQRDVVLARGKVEDLRRPPSPTRSAAEGQHLS
jgi:tRNA A-37 threonylcarbamoyl transferase component Bud32